MTVACPSDYLLQQLLDDGLSAADDQFLSRHVEFCDSCQAQLEQLLVADPVAALRAPKSASGEFETKTVTLMRRILKDSAPAIGRWRPTLQSPLDTAPRPLPEIPGYTTLRELGRGGMGVVYEAIHERLQRPVALKMLLAGALAGAKDLSRFRIEAEAIAALHDPHIVQVYDYGTYEGSPYLSLEFVAGGSLREQLKATPLPATVAAQLVETLARAMAYAHSCGVVHRDLKPANVLLDLSHVPAFNALDSGACLPHAILKISDFGLAKLLDSPAGNTGSATVLGTPSYMAPEQAGQNPAKVGPAVDICALGAILYELLTGRPPYQAETPLATLLLVLNTEPAPPSRLVPSVPRDLETICLKCLEKEPAKRYASAQALADDLRRFRAGEAIQARPVSAPERLVKWARRRPLVASLAAALAATVVVSFVLVTGQWLRAEEKAAAETRAKLDAEAKQHRADRLSISAILDLGIHQSVNGDIGTGLLRCLHSLERAIDIGAADLEHVARANLASWANQFVRQRGNLWRSGWVSAVAISPDGRWLATGGNNRTAMIWDAQTCQPQGEPLRHDDPVWSVAFSPDSRVLITGSGRDGRGAVQLWEVSCGRPLSPPLSHTDRVFRVACHPDGQSFLSVGSDRVQFWQFSGPTDSKPTVAVTPRWSWRQAGPILAGTFSADGRLVATGCAAAQSPSQTGPPAGGSIQIWDTATGAAVGPPLAHEHDVHALAFSPDGKRLLSGSRDGTGRLWDATTGQLAAPPLSHRGVVLAVAFSPDGKLCCTAGGMGRANPTEPPPPAGRGEACVWLTATGQLYEPALPHTEIVRSVAFSPNGRLLLTGAEDGDARFWQVATGTLLGPPRHHTGTVMQVAFSADGNLAITGAAGENSAAGVWEVPAGLAGEVLRHESPVRGVAFRPDGTQLVTAARGVVQVWNTNPLRPRSEPLHHTPGVNVLRWRDDGQVFLANFWEHGIRLWDGESAQAAGFAPTGIRVLSLAWSPVDANRVALGCPRFAQLFDLSSGQKVGPQIIHPNAVTAAAFSRDGRQLLTGCADRMLRRWDTSSSEAIAPPLLAGSPVEAVAWGANDQTFLSGDQAGAVQVWDAATGTPQGPPLLHQGAVHGVALDETRSILASASADRTARVWDLATGKPLTPPWSHPEAVFAVDIDKRGQVIVTGGLEPVREVLIMRHSGIVVSAFV